MEKLIGQCLECWMTLDAGLYARMDSPAEEESRIACRLAKHWKEKHGEAKPLGVYMKRVSHEETIYIFVGNYFPSIHMHAPLTKEINNAE